MDYAMRGNSGSKLRLRQGIAAADDVIERGDLPQAERLVRVPPAAFATAFDDHLGRLGKTERRLEVERTPLTSSRP
ncbi:hypothetical protein [Saccharopolyspora sp. 5N708]|uniref:hypothetical protein n=1 Tax=Saccharopolyspora sp. 5N708 TaxID=3457424 RepID=UPI003FD41F3F